MQSTYDMTQPQHIKTDVTQQLGNTMQWQKGYYLMANHLGKSEHPGQ
jgi:hypothetical protein